MIVTARQRGPTMSLTRRHFLVTGSMGGMVCFDMKNLDAQQTVTRLLEKKIVASTTPYAVPFAHWHSES